MTYKEYQKLLEALEAKRRSLIAKEQILEERYVRDNLPFEFRKYMNVTVRLRVSQDTINILDPEGKRKIRQKLGHVYSLTGCCIGFCIGYKGELRPTFWGKPNRYRCTDEVVGLEAAARQPEGDCRNCLLYEDGHCYRFYCEESDEMAVKREYMVEDGQYTCPRYVVPVKLWRVDGTQCEKATITPNTKPVMYQVYDGPELFTAWTEKDLKGYFLTSPPVNNSKK